MIKRYLSILVVALVLNHFIIFNVWCKARYNYVQLRAFLYTVYSPTMEQWAEKEYMEFDMDKN